MTKLQLLTAAAAISLGFSAISFAASPGGDTPRGMSGDTPVQKCEGLTGAARTTCMQQQLNTPRTPGRSEDATSREGGRTPGRSEDSASRTGEPPGRFESTPMGPPAAGGSPRK